MGREILERDSIFRATIERCDELFQQSAGWSLISELRQPESESRMHQTEVAQPAIFALQMALVEYLKSLGIVPAAVVGHSIGEVAAAAVAGVLTLEEAIRVVFHRGSLMQRATGSGKMAAVELSAREAMHLLIEQGCEHSVSIAAVNGPRSVTLSGEEEALVQLTDLLKRRDIVCRGLGVHYAFHSAQMEPLCGELSRELSGIQPKPARIPLVSTVTGEIARERDYDAMYWARNIRQTVQFAPAIGILVKAGYTSFVEISPHPVLSNSISQCLDDLATKGLVLTSLRRKQDARLSLLSLMGSSYVHGLPVKWEGVRSSAARYVQLPTYPWQREKYWFETRPTSSGSGRDMPGHRRKHPLLERRLVSPAISKIICETEIGSWHPAFLGDHRVFKMVVVPGAAYIEMALAVAAQAYGDDPCTLEDVLIQKALVISEGKSHALQVILDSETGLVQVFSQARSREDCPSSADWKLHATMKVHRGVIEPDTSEGSLDEVRSLCSTESPAADFYERMSEVGIEFGPSFQGIAQIWRNAAGGKALARIVVPDELQAERHDYRVHPAVLDACLQTFAAALCTDDERSQVFLPIGLNQFCFYHRPDSEFWCYAAVRPGNGGYDETDRGDIWVYRNDGQVALFLSDLQIKRTTKDVLKHAADDLASSRDWLHQIEWKVQAGFSTSPPRRGKWIILADDKGVGGALAAQLRVRGDACVLVQAGDSYESQIDGSIRIQPFQADQYDRLLDEGFSEDRRPLCGIVHLWNLGGPSCDAIELSCRSALCLAQALVKRKMDLPPRLWLVTAGAQPIQSDSVVIEHAPLWGFGRTIMLEHPELRPTCIDLDPASLPLQNGQILFDEIQADAQEHQVGFRNDERYVARLERYVPGGINHAEISPVRLEILERGTFENLSLKPMERKKPGRGEIEIRVRATGLNFRDVLNVLDMYPGNPGGLGSECAGEIAAVGDDVAGLHVGDRVLGIALDSFASFALTRAEFVVPKPPGLSYERAASLPIAFLTAYYGLHILGKIKPGNKILIHAAAGGVGMAATVLARLAGAEVYCTAGNPEKREFVRSLGARHVMDSRTVDFADELLKLTQGYGADIVLNSLSGEFIPRNLSALNPGGCLLEIGKRGIWTERQVSEIRPGARYYAYDLGIVMQEDPQLIQAMLREIVGQVGTGTLTPLPVRSFQLDRAAHAFRYMAQARHVGKIVLIQRVREAIPLPKIGPEGAYLITGGLGGVGLRIAQWIVGQGARHLVLMSRRPPTDAAQTIIRSIEQTGARVLVAQGSVACERDLRGVLEVIEQSLSPLRGIVHAAGVLDDGILQQQKWNRFERVMAPKVAGGWLLHQLTENLNLDFFVLFSSMASLLGARGQANYAAGNAFLDALAHFRRAHGLAAVSINWGAWAEVGMAAALSAEDQRRWTELGVTAMPPELGLHVLQIGLVSERPQFGAFSIDWAKYLKLFDGEVPLILSSLAGQGRASGAEKVAAEADFQIQLKKAPTAKRRSLLLAHVREKTLKVLGLSPSHPLDPHQGLREIGLDSLMSMELRNALQNSLRTPLPATLAFDYPTLERMTEHLSGVLNLLPAECSPPGDLQFKASDGLKNLSEEDAEALLLEELERNKAK